MKPQLNGIYVAVQNMDRAIRFYEDVFEIKVSHQDKRMSYFDFNGLTFLLYDPKVDRETVVRGNNIIPCIQVENLKKNVRCNKKQEV